MTHSHIAFLGGGDRFNAENAEHSHKFHRHQRFKRLKTLFALDHETQCLQDLHGTLHIPSFLRQLDRTKAHFIRLCTDVISSRAYGIYSKTTNREDLVVFVSMQISLIYSYRMLMDRRNILSWALL
jgi:hypothetical protein